MRPDPGGARQALSPAAKEHPRPSATGGVLRSADAVPVAAVQVPLEDLPVFCAGDARTGLACKLEIAGCLVLVARQGACPGDGLAGVGEVERRHLARRGLRELQAPVSYTHLTL